MPEGIRGQPLKLSRFHCREMLYDYMGGRLDAERQNAVEAGLKEYPDLKNELAAMISAAHYCAELAQISPKKELVQNFQQIRLKTEIVSEKIKYKNWPDLLRWSSEAVVISVFVAGLGWLVPWGSVQDIFKVDRSNEVVLADLSAKDKPEVVVPPLEKKSEEVKPAEPVMPIEPIKAAQPVKETSTTIVASTPVVSPKPSPVPAPKPTAAPAKVAAASIAEKKGPKGFLYRIMMNVPGIKDSAPGLRNLIIAMGGEKAGQVEIGHRQSNGNYFHFSMPETNYQKLLQTLGSYGPVRIYKGPHERVMPAGVIRIILDIQDVKGKAADKTAGSSIDESSGETSSATGSNEAPDSSEAPSTTAPAAEDSATSDTQSPGQ